MTELSLVTTTERPPLGAIRKAGSSARKAHPAIAASVALGRDVHVSIRAEVVMRHAVAFVVVLAVGKAALGASGGAAAGATPRTTPSVELPDLSASFEAEAPPEAAAPAPSSCGDGMVLVDGEYCTEVREQCAEWADPPSNRLARCARFAPSVCAGERVHKRFCIDKDEYLPPGQMLPLGGASWTDALEICEGQHKRLCLETEWEFACEGEQMLPYPTGYERDSTACNFDKVDLVDPATGKLRDQREPPSKLERCTSPFGVRSLSGNVDEWVWRDRTPGEWRSALKGGWWMPGRDRCRPATTAHGEHYRDVQTGVRCCAEAGASNTGTGNGNGNVEWAAPE